MNPHSQLDDYFASDMGGTDEIGTSLKENLKQNYCRTRQGSVITVQKEKANLRKMSINPSDIDGKSMLSN